MNHTAPIHKIGIVMNGVTGRMGTNQHLMRSLVAIRKEGGIPLPEGGRIMPEPVLVGRNAAKLAELSARAGGVEWTTDLDGALAKEQNSVYFDAQVTDKRSAALLKAIAMGKHVYAEKPVAMSSQQAMEMYQSAERAGVRHGVVQDKLWLPGLRKLKRLLDTGFFGEVLSVRGEFGYWVFEGDGVPAQRPSWNYRKEDGGGIILDMLCHWRYLLDNLFGGVRSLSCLGATHIKRRWDESGVEYTCTADDSCYATFELRGGVIANFNSSWCVRVRRDDLLTLQVDGTKGSAVAGLRECWTQHLGQTPKPVWNPDEPSSVDLWGGWTRVPDTEPYPNAFRVQWELFLRHVVCGDPFPWNLLEGAKGVQLAELGLQSWAERRWVDVPNLG